MLPQALSANTLALQLPLEAKNQQLAGFLIESIDGLAIHSRGDTRDQLKIIYDKSAQTDLELFLKAWNKFKGLPEEPVIGLDGNFNDNDISSGS